jgi:hypothetical protein
MKFQFLKDKMILAAVIGAAGTIIAGVTAALITKPPSPPEPIPTNPTPEQSAQGEWIITENGKSLKIDWDYSANIIGSDFRMRGKKIRVNNKDANRSKKLANSVYNLKFKGDKAEGDYEESNFQGTVLRGKVKLNFTENYTLVTGYLEKDGLKGSTLLGHRP